MLQHHGVGCCQAGRLHGGFATCYASHAQGADQTCSSRVRLRQGLRQPPCGAGFAIGAGYGNDVQRLRRAAVKRGGNFARILPQPLVQRQALHVLGRQRACLHKVKRFRALRFYQASRCAPQQGLAHILSGIVRRAGPGNKGFVRLHVAAIGLQAAGLRRLQPGSRFVWRAQNGWVCQFQCIHRHSDSCAASTTTPGCTDISGATPNKRKVCCTTSLNTGAATAPP